jgi:inosose dehydratase
MVEGAEQVARIFSLTRINFCPDTAHLAAAGADPARLIRDFADRIKYVHLKDLRRKPFGFLPLGEGELDMEGIVRSLVEIGFDGWIAVELDSHPDPQGAAKISRAFLNGALGAEAAR